jgi:hypothetical protein
VFLSRDGSRYRRIDQRKQRLNASCIQSSSVVPPRHAPPIARCGMALPLPQVAISHLIMTAPFALIPTHCARSRSRERAAALFAKAKETTRGSRDRDIVPAKAANQVKWMWRNVEATGDCLVPNRSGQRPGPSAECLGYLVRIVTTPHHLIQDLPCTTYSPPRSVCM